MSGSARARRSAPAGPTRRCWSATPHTSRWSICAGPGGSRKDARSPRSPRRGIGPSRRTTASVRSGSWRRCTPPSASRTRSSRNRCAPSTAAGILNSSPRCRASRAATSIRWRRRASASTSCRPSSSGPTSRSEPLRSESVMRIIFHGSNAASFSEGFAAKVGPDAEVTVLPDRLADEGDWAAYAVAEVIIGARFTADLPRPERLKLFHVPGAGYDGIALDALPAGAVVCNCFGPEQAIAEYVMAALLARKVPLTQADRDLREGRWTYWAGAPDRLHGEIAGSTIGLLGYGHIGKAIAQRAKAFEMNVVVANRSPVAASPLVDRSFALDDLAAFFAAADAYVVSLPLLPETTGIVGRDALAAMRPQAVIVNVGRGPTIDETALFEALRDRRIGGAIIDTWYKYPTADAPVGPPATLPFENLPNVLMTPHMSGWTTGTIRRRQDVIAENVRRIRDGRDCINVVRPSKQ